MSDPHERRHDPLLPPLAVILLLLAPALGAEPKPAGEETAAAPPTAAPGLVVFVDPVTGEVLERPPSGAAEETLSKAVTATLRRSGEGLVPFVLEEGGRGVFLGERFATATIVRRRADGTFELSCGEPAVVPGPAPDGAPLEEK